MFQANPDSGNLTLPSVSYERDLIDFMKQLKQNVLARLDIDGPFVLLYTLLNAKSAQLGVNDIFALDEGLGNFDRQQIILPDFLVEDPSIDEGQMLRPIFDLVWNAAGFRQSQNYDENSGIWCGT